MFLSNRRNILYPCFFIASNPKGCKKTSIFSSPLFLDGAKTDKNRYSGTVISLIIVMFLILTSCQPKALKNLTQIGQQVELEAKSMINISVGEEKTYRAQVKGFNQKMSGLLVTKKVDSMYRFVMVTDFGLKVFDFSLNEEGEYEYYHIMKHMDYEFLKNSIALNMLMLLPIQMNGEEEYYQKDDLMVYTPPKKMLYFVNDEKIHQVQRFRGKRNIWAEAELKEKSIEIHQNKPEIHIQLRPL